ncbi:Ig-like domain-containing protein [Arthrobacter sp. BE255]|uniref:Ig-like domain-containing protein n=1 Tax=Arthrobacter sp. BE255 TaxID=2817721 RepID=UPI002869ED72|nr:Ig-like domain-containing protein [Arthrobacter sp. BE255]
MLLALAALMVPSAASAAPGDVGVEGPSHSGTGTPTGTKRATSALWFNDGSWWGNLWDTASSDFHIFRFNAATSSWVNTGVATDTRANTHHDVLWDGTTLFVASYRFVNDGLPAQVNFPTTMRRYSYDSSKKTYSLLPQSSTNINNYRVEVLTIDKDSTGRVWATWQQGNRIYMNVTATDGRTWGTPFQHPASLSNVSVDDTSAVIAFDGNKMGVMWSRQVGDATDGMYWSYHVDGASNTAWTTPVAAVSGQRSSDDHMNLKWLDSSGGRVFAAVKTSFTSAPQPLIQLLALSGTTWTAYPIAAVSECPNRVIVLIDESTQMLRTFATYPKPSGTTNAGVCTSSGGAIYEKSTPLNNINFTTAKTARIVDADQYVHNVTSTKQNLNSAAQGTANSGLLVLADVNATNRYWHYYDPSVGGGDTTAPTVTDTSPAAGATGVAVTANVTGTFSEAMNASTVTSTTFTLTGPGTTPVSAAVTYNSTGNVATLNPNADLAANTTYTATIKGGSGGVKDVAGNPLALDKVWTFTTASVGDTTAPTVTVTSPDANATGVAVTANVTGTFSEAMNPSTVTSTTFTLTGPGTTPVSAAVSYNGTGNVATLNPAADLAANTTYTATIKGGSGGVKDVAGNPLALDKVWTFTTAPAGDTTAPTVTDTSPAAGATGVAVSANVTGTFSEAMNASTVTSTTFTLTGPGTTPVSAAVSYNGTGNVATLNPAADLAANTTYTATIKGGSGGVKDVAGNPLALDKVWTFTTAPAGGGTGIQRQGMSTLVNTTATTSHTISKPASAGAGQVCVASLALNGSTVSAAPTGWTQFAAITSISNPHLYGYYHVMGASEPASYTWTTAGSVASGGGISCYSGVNTTTPLDTTASVAASAVAASTGSVAGVTTTTAGAMLVGAIAINSSNTTIVIAGPSDMAEVYDLGGKRTELDDGLQAAAGSSGSKSWVWSSGSAREWAGWLVALRAQ